MWLALDSLVHGLRNYTCQPTYPAALFAVSFSLFYVLMRLGFVGTSNTKLRLMNPANKNKSSETSSGYEMNYSWANICNFYGINRMFVVLARLRQHNLIFFRSSWAKQKYLKRIGARRPISKLSLYLLLANRHSSTTYDGYVDFLNHSCQFLREHHRNSWIFFHFNRTRKSSKIFQCHSIKTLSLLKFKKLCKLFFVTTVCWNFPSLCRSSS